VRPRFSRRLGPVGVALTAWDIWRRLPPKQRKQILNLARKHGPKVASRVMRARARSRSRRSK
jgi:DNA-binding transcriptional regulator YiaG